MFTMKILESIRRARVFALGGIIAFLLLPSILWAQNGNKNAQLQSNCPNFTYKLVDYRVENTETPYTVFKWEIQQLSTNIDYPKNGVSHFGFFVGGGEKCDAKTKKWLDDNYTKIKAAFSSNSAITEESADCNSSVSWGTDPSCRKLDWVLKVSNPGISTYGKTFYVLLKIPGKFKKDVSSTISVKYGNYCCDNSGKEGIGCLDECNMSAAATATYACYGQKGKITLSVTGSEGELTYMWTGPGGYTASAKELNSTQTLNNLDAGLYTVTATDTRACKAIGSATVTVGSQITANAVPSFTCYGYASGSIALSVSGGKPGYTYSWTAPGGYTANTGTINSLTANTYNVTVSDSKGCTETASATVTTNPQIMVTATGSKICVGGTNGTVDLVVQGGCGANYTYSWTAPGGFTATGASLTGLTVNTYSFTVADGVACKASNSVMVSAYAPVAIASTVGNVCYGSTNGSIKLSASGGCEAGYTYSWTGAGGFTSTGASLTGLTANAIPYSVTVSDNKTCKASESYTITTNPQLFITATPSFACYGAGTGSVSLKVEGGTSGYTYAWTAPGGYTGNTGTIVGLTANKYNVIVTDSKSCTITADAMVTSNPKINIMSTVNNVSCDGTDDGSVYLNVSGGTGSLMFIWNGPSSFTSTDMSITSLSVGTYTITVTDEKSCSTTSSFEVDQNKCPNVVCTYTQGYFGNAGGKSSFPDGEGGCEKDRSTKYALAYALGKWVTLKIGNISLTTSSVDDIIAYLPGGGPYSQYSTTTNTLVGAPKTTLITQVLTLGLNIGLNGGPNGRFAKMDVTKVFHVQHLGSCDATSTEEGMAYSISDLPEGVKTVKEIFMAGSAAVANGEYDDAKKLAEAAGKLNEIFDECGLVIEEDGAVAKGSGLNAGALSNNYAQNLKDLSVAAYPNPFTDKVTIKFASPVSGDATIEFFDMTGRKLQSISRTNIIAGQYNTIEYQVPAVNSKAVIYRVSIGNFSVNGKLVGQR